MPAKAVATVPITGILRVTGQGGNHIVQINPFKSVDTICGHYSLFVSPTAQNTVKSACADPRKTQHLLDLSCREPPTRAKMSGMRAEVYSSRMNSSTVMPACSMMEMSVLRFKSLL
jgi:hypothetical protein